MAIEPVKQSSVPDLKTLGLKSPMEVIDVLSLLEFDSGSGKKLVINDDKAFLNPQLKAEQVIKFFKDNFDLSPNELPRLASIVKQDLRAGRLKVGGMA